MQRARDPADGRRVIVEVTREGVDAFAPYLRSPELSQRRLYAPYDTRELRVIHDFLQRSTQRLRTATAHVTGRAED